MARGIALVGLLMLMGAEGGAQPQIMGIQGDAQSGQTFTIQGSGFGDKLRAAPLMFDDFQNGVLGELLMTSEGGWQEGAHLPVYSEEFQYFYGDIACKQSFGPGEMGFPKRSSMELMDSALNQVYFNGLLFIDHPPRGSDTDARLVWLLGHWDEAYTTPAGFRAYPDQGHDVGRLYSTPCGGQDRAVVDQGAGLPSFGDWHLVEFWHGSDAESGMESMYLQIDGDRVLEGSAENTSCDLSVFSILPFIDDQADQAALDFYWSSVYVDSTQARIEMGDFEQYDGCTQRAVLIPQFWSDTEITFSLDSTSLPVSETLYLYVTNEGGLVNESGFEIYGYEDGPLQPLNMHWD